MQYVFLMPDKDYVRIMLKDLKGRENVMLITPGRFAKSNRLKRVVIEALLARFNDSPPGLLNPFWFPDVIERSNADDEVVYIFFRTTRFSHNRAFLRWLKTTGSKVRTIMIYLDVIVEAKYRQIENEFDLIYTFDERDAAKYQIPQIAGLYSNLDIKSGPTLYDLVFVGESKDRYPLLNDIYHKLNQVEISSKFHVYDQSPRQTTADDLQTTTEFIPYKAVLDLQTHSNVILDIVQPDQRGATLRFFEALALNKKLLTNNRSIATNKYFNPAYMQIMTSSEDIDLSFIHDRVNVDYQYQGDYSPLKLLKRIESDLSERISQ